MVADLKMLLFIGEIIFIFGFETTLDVLFEIGLLKKKLEGFVLNLFEEGAI